MAQVQYIIYDGINILHPKLPFSEVLYFVDASFTSQATPKSLKLNVSATILLNYALTFSIAAISWVSILVEWI